MHKVLVALIGAVALVALLAASPASASGDRSHTSGRFPLEVDG